MSKFEASIEITDPTDFVATDPADFVASVQTDPAVGPYIRLSFQEASGDAQVDIKIPAVFLDDLIEEIKTAEFKVNHLYAAIAATGPRVPRSVT